MTACHNTKLSTICLTEQPSYRSNQWGTPRTFAATGAGGANGDTIVSTVLGGVSSGDDDFVGMWVTGKNCSDARNNGISRRITAYANASGTATVDRFPAQTADGDVFELVANVLPYWSEDTGAAATGPQDASRSEADDYWNGTAQEGGPYMEIVEADNVAKTALLLITDFANATGKATTAAMGANTAVGDFSEAWMCPEIMTGEFECTREGIPREVFQGTYDTPNDLAGLKAASGALEFAFRGPGRGRDGLQAELHRYLGSVMTPYADAVDLTVNGAGSVSSIPYDAGTAVVGRMYVTAEGSAFMCSSAGTPAVPEPNLQSVAQDDTTVTGLMTYHPDTCANYHLAAKQYRGNGIIEYIFGLLPNIQIAGELNSWLKITMDMMGSDWFRIHKDSAGDISRAWQAKRPTVAPVRMSNARCNISDTDFGVKSFSLDFGFDRQPMQNLDAPNESDGLNIVGYKPVGQVVLYLNSTNKTLMDDFIANYEKELLIQVGTTPGYPGVFAFWADSIGITNYSIQDDGGQLTATIDWKVNATSSTTLPTCAIAIG